MQFESAVVFHIQKVVVMAFAQGLSQAIFRIGVHVGSS
jgi:hypothetical protein